MKKNSMEWNKRDELEVGVRYLVEKEVYLAHKIIIIF